MSIKREAAPLILTAAFVLLILALNQWLFTKPVIEFADLAANSLAVQQAKHFTLMTGNYSRWGFHHPGPAFLYLFALGEFLFWDVLHVAAAPYNAQVIIFIIFCGFLLFLTLHVIGRNVHLSPAMALLVVTVVAVMVNMVKDYGGPPLLMISTWPPSAPEFPYLLFAVSAASVLAGSTRDLPYMAFAGMLLIHAHFAQFLFVGVIGGGTLAVILVRAYRAPGLPNFLRERKRDFAIAAAIVFIFALPPLIEIMVDHPNNLDALLTYERRFGLERNNLGAAIGYMVSLFLFIDPTAVMPKGPEAILSMGLSQPRVLIYWIVFGLLLVVAISRIGAARRKGRAPFLKYAIWISAVTCILFLFWGTRITGGFFAFNGGFIYAIHMLAWFLVLAQIERTLDQHTDRLLGIGAVILAVVLGVEERQALILRTSGALDVRQAAEAAPTEPFGKLALIFAFDDREWAAGVANSMKRLGKPFCVNPAWEFMFSRGTGCPDMLAADSLSVSHEPQACVSPCRVLFQSAALSEISYSLRKWTLPLTVGVQGMPGLIMLGFNASEVTHRWLTKHAAIQFWLADGQPVPACYRLDLTGYDFPGRPMRLAVNGQPLATLSNPVRSTSTYTLPASALHPGAGNSITMDTDNAGPVGHDPRDLGFDFVSLTLRVADPGESCNVTSAAATH